MKLLGLFSLCMLFALSGYSQQTGKNQAGEKSLSKNGKGLTLGGFQKPGLQLNRSEVGQAHNPAPAPAQSPELSMPVAKPNPNILYSALAYAPDSTVQYHLRVKKP